ncbi:hypothetical protein D9758_001210 [Tetrapyrgos nigripes]|uniref:F-box domain-containing protein n=1 Tax=Tetrapyrgos nigripes TaxID=182062 RepID=A0A8H5GS37_9AGAR|nr:hypothetical protein D9758_001210 [Tetrapyrgos nigripes]
MDDRELRLPLEIWSSVFDLIETSSLSRISLACRSFRWILYPRLFRSLRIICQFSDDIFVYLYNTSHRKGLADAFARLEFFSSAAIAPCLRSCTISFQKWPDPVFEPVLNKLCDHLSRFTNLQRLAFENVMITSQRAQLISLTRPLEKLSFANCSMETDISLSQKITTDELTLRYDRGKCSGDHSNAWLSLIHTTSLQELDARSSALETLSEIATNKIPLPSMKVIHLNCEDDVISSDHLRVALPMCQSLSRLYLEPRKGGMLLSFPHITQHLSFYEGPHYFLQFLQGEQNELRRVKLFGDRYQGICDLIDIQQDFQYFHIHAPMLESMHLRAFPTSELCRCITLLFPNLRSLAFWLPLQTQALCPMLALTHESFLPALMKMCLPCHLENLVILGMLFSNSIEGAQVIEHLTKKYQSLRHIYLYFPQGYWVTWSQSSDSSEGEGGTGPERGEMAVGPVDVEYDWFS